MAWALNIGDNKQGARDARLASRADPTRSCALKNSKPQRKNLSCERSNPLEWQASLAALACATASLVEIPKLMQVKPDQVMQFGSLQVHLV
jgi:hypothetical protein